MSLDKQLDRLKQRFNDSCFFSTEVSSTSRLEKQESRKGKNMFRISSKFTDQPVTYFRKIKDKHKEAKNMHLSAIKNHLKLRKSVDRTQKQASLCRHQFIKLYHNKKFKLSQNSSMEDHKIENQRYFRLSVQKFKRQRWEDQISATLRKQDHMKKIQELQCFRKTQEKKFRQTFRANQEKLRRQALNSHDKVRHQRQQFYHKKKNLQDMLATKSKFNYMSKINQQMARIKNCQQKLKQMDDENPESQSEGQTLPNIFAVTQFNRLN